MSSEPFAIIEIIESATGLRIHSSKILSGHSGTLVLEVNDEWVFRFSTSGPWPVKTHKQLDFLARFASRSPVAIPEPAFVTEHFFGYKKIAGNLFTPGDPFSPAEMERLGREDKQHIAKQFGLFLSALHQSHDDSIDFDTGYLSLRKGYFRSTPVNLREHLRVSERRRLDAKLEAVADNPANFVEPTRIIHGDLCIGNILWDNSRGTITGVIDWSEMGLGIPAMDFVALADFTTNRNDQFLSEIVRWYGLDDSLFNQIKANAIIEVLNWFWFHENRKDRDGMVRAMTRLKSILNA